jgi:predicted phage terminase large subunit-like protein
VNLDDLAASIGATVEPSDPLIAAVGGNADLAVDAITAELERRRFEAFAPRALESMYEFGVAAFEAVLEPGTPLELSWHHEVITRHCQWQLEERRKCAESDNYWSPAQNLIENLPPRCLKTVLITVCGPAWAWLHEPNLRIRALSTNPRVSNGAAYATYRLVTSEWYARIREWGVANLGLPRWDIDPKRSAPTNLLTTAGGARVAVGYNGEIVGEGSDWLLIDDPNDPDEVESETVRDAVNDRYDNSIESRVNHPRVSCRTIIQQRTHARDLSGHLLANERANWVHLCVTQEYGHGPCHTCADDLIARTTTAHECPDTTSTPIWVDPRTEVGELLHPERFSPEFVAQIKAGEGGVTRFNCQHNQNPTVIEGNLMCREWFRLLNLEQLPKLREVVISLDANAKRKTKNKKSSRAALVAVGRTDLADRYVVDAWAKRGVGFKAIAEAVIEMHDRVRDLGHSGAIKFLVEAAALGHSVIEELEDQLKQLNVPITEVTPGDDKSSRGEAARPVVECGNVAVLKGPWVEEFLAEVCGYPLYATDDLFDAFTQAINQMRGSARLSAFSRAFSGRAKL